MRTVNRAGSGMGRASNSTRFNFHFSCLFISSGMIGSCVTGVGGRKSFVYTEKKILEKSLMI